MVNRFQGGVKSEDGDSSQLESRKTEQKMFDRFGAVRAMISSGRRAG